MTTKEKFENNISPHTLWLIQRLIRTDQAKPGLVIFMSKVLSISQDEALKFFKEYKEHINEQKPVATRPT